MEGVRLTLIRIGGLLVLAGVIIPPFILWNGEYNIIVLLPALGLLGAGMLMWFVASIRQTP